MGHRKGHDKCTDGDLCQRATPIRAGERPGAVIGFLTPYLERYGTSQGLGSRNESRVASYLIGSWLQQPGTSCRISHPPSRPSLPSRSQRIARNTRPSKGPSRLLAVPGILIPSAETIQSGNRPESGHSRGVAPRLSARPRQYPAQTVRGLAQG